MDQSACISWLDKLSNQPFWQFWEMYPDNEEAAASLITHAAALQLATSWKEDGGLLVVRRSDLSRFWPLPGEGRDA